MRISPEKNSKRERVQFEPSDTLLQGLYDLADKEGIRTTLGNGQIEKVESDNA